MNTIRETVPRAAVLLLPVLIMVFDPRVSPGAPYQIDPNCLPGQYPLITDYGKPPAGLEFQPAPPPAAELTPSDASSNPPDFKQFGWEVAVSGNGELVAVGAEEADIDLNNDGKIQWLKENDLGAVYLYRLIAGKWIETQLTASDGSYYDAFGSSVAVSSDGKMIVVGAKGDDPHSYSGAGAVYIYEEVAPSRGAPTKWKETKITLPAWEAQTFAGFGSSVDVSRDKKRIVIGAPGSSVPPGNKKGAVHLFEKKSAGWVEVNRFDAFDTYGWFFWDGFGKSIAISEDGKIVVAGSPAQNTYRGAAYLFVEDAMGWTEHKLDITPPAGTPAYLDPMDEFGSDVDIAGDLIVIGTPQNLYQYFYYNLWPAAGAAYVYRVVPTVIDYGEMKVTTRTYQLIKKLTYAKDANPGDNFGYSVSTARTGDTSVVAIGSPGWSINYCNYYHQGLVHVFNYDHNVGTWDHPWQLNVSECTHTGDENQFGSAVTVSEDCSTLVGGAPGCYSGYIPSEEVHVFRGGLY